MATFKEMEPELNISDEGAPSGEKAKILGMGDSDYFLPPLPSVEQMRMDVANAACELQQAFFQQKQNHEPESDRYKSSAEILTQNYLETTLDGWKNNTRSDLERIDDPRQRTQEETMCEELIINGKKYRHTFQKRVVLESQKTREIFVLPASSESKLNEELPRKENYVSSNFDRYNRAFEDSGIRLDLQVHNQEGDFSPMLVIAPHGESPGGPRSPSISVCRGTRVNEQGYDSMPAAISQEEFGNSSRIPLVVSHMYHFGQWNKTASILNPRLPTSLCIPTEFYGKDSSIFCVTPAEWHHSDITYGGETAGASGTTAKARIVACLQRFTQHSPQTGKELHRSTYVQHTKIARWRSSQKRDDVASGPGAEEQPSHSDAQSSTLENGVANVSDVWKQCARSPLGGGDSSPVISDSSLRLCPYNRLQLLQSLCPAAAAAIMILGGRMPEMRNESCPNQSPNHHVSVVTAEAWCPRTLMTTEGIEDLLLFSLPDGLEIDSPSPKQNCLLRGGTLDGLLIYALKIFHKNKSDTYESLIPNIFMRLYPTFTIATEVVNRLIQRYLAFVPIEPGGLGCLETNEEISSDAQWKEALGVLHFLLSLLRKAKRELCDAKLETKIFRFAQLLKVDSRIIGQQSSGQNVCVIDEIDDEDLVSIHGDSTASNLTEENPISAELNRISECLLDLLTKEGVRGGFAEDSSSKRLIKTNQLAREDSRICSCQQRLNYFLQLGVKELAEQITAMEEVFFDAIEIYELINIKDLERGNTPTLSRCVQHFNDLNSTVRCLILIAKELGKPISKVQPTKGEDFILVEDTINSFRICPLCGLDKRPLVQPDLMKDNLQSFSGSVTRPRRSSLKSYLCMSPITQTPSMRVRKRNFQLDKTLSHLCDLAETLKGMNNFSSFLAVVLGLQNVPTQNILKKTKMRLNELGAYMLPPNFSAYRRDLEAAKMPCLPYLGLIFQQLIHLDSGNLLFLSSPSEEGNTSPSCNDRDLITGDEVDANKVINFWRCWKHYLILGYFMKKTDKGMLDENEKVSYEIENNLEIQSFLNSFRGYSAKLRQDVHPSSGPSSRRKQRTHSATFNTLP